MIVGIPLPGCPPYLVEILHNRHGILDADNILYLQSDTLSSIGKDLNLRIHRLIRQSRVYDGHWVFSAKDAQIIVDILFQRATNFEVMYQNPAVLRHEMLTTDSFQLVARALGFKEMLNATDPASIIRNKETFTDAALNCLPLLVNTPLIFNNLPKASQDDLTMALGLFRRLHERKLYPVVQEEGEIPLMRRCDSSAVMQAGIHYDIEHNDSVTTDPNNLSGNKIAMLLQRAATDLGGDNAIDRDALPTSNLVPPNRLPHKSNVDDEVTVDILAKETVGQKRVREEAPSTVADADANNTAKRSKKVRPAKDNILPFYPAKVLITKRYINGLTSNPTDDPLDKIKVYLTEEVGTGDSKVRAISKVCSLSELNLSKLRLGKCYEKHKLVCRRD